MDEKLKFILDEIYFHRHNMENEKKELIGDFKTGYSLALYDFDKLIEIIKIRFEKYSFEVETMSMEDVVYELKYLTAFLEDYKKPVRGYIPKKLRHQLLIEANYKCKMCQTDKDLEIDHIIPVSRGGTDDFNNLQVLCKKCNLEKFTSIIKNGTNN